MNMLMTAFSGIHNSSYQLIQAYDSDKLYLTNTFKGIDRKIKNFDFSLYSGVIMFGLDNRLKTGIRLEPRAILDGNIISTAYNIGDFVDMFKHNNLNVTVAEKPTEYLCNYAYYRVLQATAERALFIHIPPERYLTEEIKNGIKNVIGLIKGEL